MMNEDCDILVNLEKEIDELFAEEIDDVKIDSGASKGYAERMEKSNPWYFSSYYSRKKSEEKGSEYEKSRQLS